MLIRCPTCASGYDVPADLLADGRILRCAHCRDAWVHDGTAAEASLARLPVVVEALPGRQLPVAALPKRPPIARAPRVGGSLAAGAMLLAAVTSGMAAVGQRERIVASFPPSAAAFAALGLPVNLRGLALADLRSTVAALDGSPTLTLDGSIRNLRSQSTPVPTIRIAVRDASERELYYWTAPAPKPRLAAGETMPFRLRLSAPPRDGETLSVSFADARPAGARHLAEAFPAGR